MKGKLIKKLPKSPFTYTPQSTYGQRTFNSAVGIKSPVQSQLFGFSAVGTIPGGVAQGYTVSTRGHSYFNYIDDVTYFEIINGEEYYVVT